MLHALYTEHNHDCQAFEHLLVAEIKCNDQSIKLFLVHVSAHYCRGKPTHFITLQEVQAGAMGVELTVSVQQMHMDLASRLRLQTFVNLFDMMSIGCS